MRLRFFVKIKIKFEGGIRFITLDWSNGGDLRDWFDFLGFFFRSFWFSFFGLGFYWWEIFLDRGRNRFFGGSWEFGNRA